MHSERELPHEGGSSATLPRFNVASGNWDRGDPNVCLCVIVCVCVNPSSMDSNSRCVRRLSETIAFPLSRINVEISNCWFLIIFFCIFGGDTPAIRVDRRPPIDRGLRYPSEIHGMYTVCTCVQYVAIKA